MKKLLALVLALMLALSMAYASGEGAETPDWDYDDYAAHAALRYELSRDYTGKTVILHTNDVHGRIDGYALIAALRDHLVSLGAEVILADAGDFSQGTPYVNSDKGATAVTLMNAAGYDVVTLGNHEFDFGLPQLMENLSKAEFSLICSNITVDETGEALFPASVLFTTGSGLKIGFVGADTPEAVTKANPALTRSLTIASFDQLYESIRKGVEEVRAEADLVFGLFHLGVDNESRPNGFRSVDVLARVNGIDMVLDGHSHTVMTAGQHGEPVQSTGTGFENIGVVVIDNESKGIESNFLVPTFVASDLYRFSYADEGILEAARDVIARVDAEYQAVFASSEVPLNGERESVRTEETNLADLIADAVLWSVLKEGGIEQVEPNAVVCVYNGGSIRASIAEGDITKQDINTVLPFGNTVAVVYLTGAELLEALEASTYCTPDSIGGYPQTSGLEWVIDSARPYDRGELYKLNGKESTYYAPASISRVSVTSVNGEPFDVNAVYAVVTTDFCASGGDTYNAFARSISSFDTGIPLDEVVMAYITEVLGGKVPANPYAAPRGAVTLLR